MERRSGSDPILEAEILDVQPLRILAPAYPGPYGYCGSFPAGATNAPPSYPSSNPLGSQPPQSYNPMYYCGHANATANANAHAHTHAHAHAQPAAAKQDTDTPQHVDSGESPSTASGDAASDVEMVGCTNKSSSAGPAPSSSKVSDGGPKGSPAKSARRKMGARKSTGAWKRSKKMPPPGVPSEERTPSSSRRRSGSRKPKPTASSSHLLASLVAVEDARESVERTLIIFDGLRKRLSQIEDASKSGGANPASAGAGGSMSSSSSFRPDLKAGSTMSAQGVRVNATKRLGAVPGVEIGDIFFFRFEMCLVGLHSPSMAGIDYMVVKSGKAEDPTAVSIVSSGVYENDMADSDVLIYTGQGGITTPGKQVDNQKLERGNLALRKSLDRGNDIRVVRGVKDVANPTSKIYIYDGLYRVQESWTEQGKAGFSVFKFKLVRVQGQPEGSACWKRIQHWKDDPLSRPSVILPDISYGLEKMPICLVNEVDREKGPAYFSYATKVKYLKPVESVQPLPNCQCINSCSFTGSQCPCKHLNGGLLPFTSNGQLVVRKQVIYECGSCSCSINCKNRVSQKGINIRFEVFRTKDKGWGLRSWDPIRAGSFICEFVGEVCDYAGFANSENGNDYVFDATAWNTENSFGWNYRKELIGEEDISSSDISLMPLSIVINAQRMGNVSRFMNHSCSPNVFWQPVMFDHSDERYPHIMLYAIKHIPPLTELAYDYGSKGSNFQKKKCLCGSPKCMGFFYN